MLSPLRAIAGRPRPPPQTVAAVDLGSNSFHLIVARVDNGDLHVIDRLQEMVRIGGGLDERGNLDKEARARALACLARFGERLRGLPSRAVRAVGTDALRRARNGKKFLTAAERVLGHRIALISGQEEARLIYRGVAHELPDDDGPRLVVDIGGGSTEFVVGRRLEPGLAESLHIGCVSLSRRYFKSGRPEREAWQEALTAARLELQPIATTFRGAGWHGAFGASGTIRAVAAVLRAHGWSDGSITMAGLARVRDALLGTPGAAPAPVNGLSPERAPVFPGGVAILIAVFQALGIERMEPVGAALREGLLYDLVGRRHTDARDRAIAAVTARYQLDGAQAERVQQTAARCFAQVARAWQLDETHGQSLSWAARLHELGLAVAHTKYHRHGAYLVAHADLPGFSREEQLLVAALVRAHRRRFPREVFAALPKRERRAAARLAVLLRAAVLLHRARAPAQLPPIRLAADARALQFKFPRGWLRKNPLTRADLEQEARYLKTARFSLRFR